MSIIKPLIPKIVGKTITGILVEEDSSSTITSKIILCFSDDTNCEFYLRKDSMFIESTDGIHKGSFDTVRGDPAHRHFVLEHQLPPALSKTIAEQHQQFDSHVQEEYSAWWERNKPRVG